MTQQIQQWQQKIDELTQEFNERFSDLSPDELNRKPNAQTWSIAENIQHLITVNESYYPVLEQLKEGKYKAPFTAKLPFFVKFMGNTILKSVQPDRRKKMRTFPIWEPQAASVDANIVAHFAEHQGKLKNLIASSSDLLQKGTIISSPANRNIVYTLDKAFDIIVAHEERHLNQAIEAFDTIYRNQYNYDM